MRSNHWKTSLDVMSEGGTDAMRLEELRKLCEAATPGSWRRKISSANTVESEHVAQELWNDRRRIGFTDWHRVCSLDMHFDGSEDQQHIADIAFIAASRTYMPLFLKLWEAAIWREDCSELCLLMKPTRGCTCGDEKMREILAKLEGA